jgi:hypothetical protein
MRSRLLRCGVASALIYVVTDIAAGLAYPGYDFADQAVSELFAIGAPTSRLVVPLFSVSSLLFGLSMSLIRQRDAAPREPK